VTGTDGNVLATTTTDDAGHFRIEAKRRVDHRIIVDGGDGHVATYTIRADELPDSLFLSPPTPLVQAGEGSLPALSAPGTDWRTFIDQSIARQIRPFREQIDCSLVA